MAGAGAAAAVAAVGSQVFDTPSVAKPKKAPATGPASAGTGGANGWKHAGMPRGADIVASAGKGTEGRFGVMFKNLPAFSPPDELLRHLAVQVGAEPDERDNPDVPAGITFLGQFIDHDLTLDLTPMPEQEMDTKGLTNFDSPLLDLSSVYGKGPASDPDLYEADRTRMKVVRNQHGVDDLPRRVDGTAIIGDPRNDENLIITQLQIAFLQFHNRCLELGLANSFDEARRLTRWYFQWTITHEFLPAVAGPGIVERYLDDRPGKKAKFSNEFYKPKNKHKPMMPLEFSVAGFRFGHSMVRAEYQLNGSAAVPLFHPSQTDLRGSRALNAALQIEWWRYFDVPGQPSNPRNLSRRIDSRIAIPLLSLPSTVVGDPMVSLAERNLVRAKRLGLPAGQDVAAAMGVDQLSNADLDLPFPHDPGWGGKAPLWFYILKESEIVEDGRVLGPVGSRLIAEVIVGILGRDPGSYVNAKNPFQPAAPIATRGRTFGMGDFVAFAQGG